MSSECYLCPNKCCLSENSFGVCGVRGWKNDSYYLPYHGVLSAVSIDPIEKKPLYHYHPGADIYSVGFFGCSLSCPFCQNYTISKEFGSSNNHKHYKPSEVVKAALSKGSFGIAYTYSEPLIHYEWLIECLKKARSSGLKNILVTNGYINREPGLEILKYTDAVNIDLKSFNDSFYRSELKGALQPVLDFISESSSRVHTEITTLVIPGKNDSQDEISSSADFISGIDRNIPWHLSAYYPAYKYNVPPTQPERLKALVELASKKLNFVFTGNIGGSADSICPVCGNTLIKRRGYTTSVSGISGELCTGCGTMVSEFGITI